MRARLLARDFCSDFTLYSHLPLLLRDARRNRAPAVTGIKGPTTKEIEVHFVSCTLGTCRTMDNARVGQWATRNEPPTGGKPLRLRHHRIVRNTNATPKREDIGCPSRLTRVFPSGSVTSTHRPVQVFRRRYPTAARIRANEECNTGHDACQEAWHGRPEPPSASADKHSDAFILAS